MTYDRMRGFIRRPDVNEFKELAKLEYMNFSEEEAIVYKDMLSVP